MTILDSSSSSVPSPSPTPSPSPSPLPLLPATFFLGISGKARHGKDTFAWAVVDRLRELGVDARRYAFADALKTLARAEYGMTTKDAPFLQQLGVAYRERYADHWVRTLWWQIAEDAPQVAVIADVRFENEAEGIRGTGGAVVRVKRPGFVDPSRPATHVSETALDAYAHFFGVFLNDGTPWQLRLAARAFAEYLERRLEPQPTPE